MSRAFGADFPKYEPRLRRGFSCSPQLWDALGGALKYPPKSLWGESRRLWDSGKPETLELRDPSRRLRRRPPTQNRLKLNAADAATSSRRLRRRPPAKNRLKLNAASGGANKA